MGLFRKFIDRFRPPYKEDPEFGDMSFIKVSPRGYGKSYWEATIYVPQIGASVEVFLQGEEDGPLEVSKEFYRKLIPSFDAIIAAARPLLAKEYLLWMQEELPDDIFTVLTLSGFSVEDPAVVPAKWDIMFETMGEKWRAISIYFEGDKPVGTTVDT